MQNPMAFTPDQIEIIDILFITVIETYLVSISIILQLPIRWRGNNKLLNYTQLEIKFSAAFSAFSMTSSSSNTLTT